MEEIVVDASVVVKWYVVEDLRERALKIRDDYIDGKLQLSAPCLMPFEVLNAVRYAGRNIDARKLEEIAESLRLYGIKLHTLQDEYAKQTIRTALENEITVYDASYIALAEQLRTTLYTSDRVLINSLQENYKMRTKHLTEYT